MNTSTKHFPTLKKPGFLCCQRHSGFFSIQYILESSYIFCWVSDITSQIEQLRQTSDGTEDLILHEKAAGYLPVPFSPVCGI